MGNLGKIKVEFACDENENHKTPMRLCTTSRIKEFNSVKEAEEFKADCTYVYTMNDINTTPLIAKGNFVQEALETCNI